MSKSKTIKNTAELIVWKKETFEELNAIIPGFPLEKFNRMLRSEGISGLSKLDSFEDRDGYESRPVKTPSTPTAKTTDTIRAGTVVRAVRGLFRGTEGPITVINTHGRPSFKTGESTIYKVSKNSATNWVDETRDSIWLYKDEVIVVK